MHFQTTDLCDAHEDQLLDGRIQIVEPIFRHFGGRRSFAGPIATLKLFEDNSLVRSTLETEGAGRVLVVDGGGSLRCALVGDQLAELGVRNGWAGVLVWGCIRDSGAIANMELGVLALATHPRKSLKKGIGTRDLEVQFASVRFKPGAWLYADEDGAILADAQLV
ncbi:MAG: ribonuclease E activity regulator RraA [Betaproteobacteria bacterium]|nr:ribonuclease E activity regulator RraA [Betaproteobacteria bacterium]